MRSIYNFPHLLRLFVYNHILFDVSCCPNILEGLKINDPDILEWKINNQIFNNTNSNPYEITLESGNTAGQAELEFHVRDRKEVLQGVEDSVDINISE